LHNYTIKQLKNRFGGYFATDNGKNKYLKNENPYIQKEEAGCYQAYGRFFGNLHRASYTINTWISAKTDVDWASKKIGEIDFIDSTNPLVLTVNMAIPFIVSIIEDYFRSTYLALLKYSQKKELIIRDSRLQMEDIVLVTKGEITVEDAIARSRSFQNIKRIDQSFRDLDKKIDLNGILNRPYPKYKKPIYNTFDDLISKRHGIIHRAEFVLNYSPKKLLKDMQIVEIGVKEFYKALIEINNWSDSHPDLNRNAVRT
jgi:hypothetical protein